MTLPTRRAVRLLLAAAAIGAGTIHLVLAPAHLEEWLPLGVAFLVAGTLQVVGGAALAVRESRVVLRAVAVLSVLVLGAYVVSRTSGLPVGPSAFQPEPLALADLICCALEVPLAVGALLLARRPQALRTPMTRRIAAVVGAGLVLIVSGTGVAVAAPQHAHTSHHHEACPSEPQLTGVKNAQGVDTGVTAYFACRLAQSHGH